MAKSETLIRVAAAVPWPGNHVSPSRPHTVSKKWERPKILGEMILTIGTPKEPDSHWTCGTDVVWPVYEINGEKVEPDPGRKLPYVCRHQILAGD